MDAGDSADSHGMFSKAGEETPVDFTDMWDVVSSPDFADEHLTPGRSRVPQVTFRQNGKYVKGDYEIGAVGGTIDGGAHSDFVDFHFWGNDDMEEVFGEGQATLEGERLIFELWYYLGDEWTFVCERRR